MNDVNPNGVVPIPDFSPQSLKIVIGLLERSTRFQHYILRADELDAVSRHIDLALNAPAPETNASADLERLRAAVLAAHEQVIAGSPHVAAELLRPFAG